MVRKYPERVTASMTRVLHEEEILLIRHTTEIHFGESNELLGMVVMTNPGKFEFNKVPEWEAFKSGKGSVDTFEASDFPDLSMQNVIEVINSAYEAIGRSKPNGILRVYNLSNVRQPDGQKAEIYHNRAKKALSSTNLTLLEDPITHSRDMFMNECDKANFVIMGFVNGAFDQEMQQVRTWSEGISRLVCAVDNKGHYSHPRRWRTDLALKNQAIASLKSVLLGNKADLVIDSSVSEKLGRQY
ncbi:hypothetical protein R50345_08870 [Paenibacillus sp. FSL R5-0345]|uniref:hypothetical protein n=1 Tax=Paenibacillus sp. FSL R5-0345 TaxID=1536770 RepID=UPI0004F6059E|nr:hypothetical protein [Paenibacillus sp. FSL R5-0345]AIQ34714.1 hypothetical protein R50345_08870 [Paenibacillus sp. FSL R5-0345]